MMSYGNKSHGENKAWCWGRTQWHFMKGKEGTPLRWQLSRDLKEVVNYTDVCKENVLSKRNKWKRFDNGRCLTFLIAHCKKELHVSMWLIAPSISIYWQQISVFHWEIHNLIRNQFFWGFIKKWEQNMKFFTHIPEFSDFLQGKSWSIWLTFKQIFHLFFEKKREKSTPRKLFNNEFYSWFALFGSNIWPH